MNLSEQQVQAHRPSISSNTCDRHPDEIFTGFCPLCLCERLSILDHSSSLRKPNTTATTTTTNTAAAAIKAIFKVSDKALRSGSKASSSTAVTTSSFFPELRRTKSFSASRERFSGVFEPQRKSCDVKVRNTLWSLFNQDDERKGTTKNEGVRPELEVETRNLACCSSSSFVTVAPVFESKEEEEELESVYEEEEDESDEIRVCDEQKPHNVVNVGEIRVDEIVGGAIEDERNIQHEDEVKTIKDHIDLDSLNKKASGRDFKEIAGSFWSAASVFSKKLQKWRRKQKLKKHGNGGGCSTLPVEKPIGRQYRETQSEIADYGFGRRSCDTDPRFSLDAGRMSFDDLRYSFDEPRASWDGYLIGKTFPRLTPMLSVVEDVPANHVPRFDKHIPVEEPRISINEDETLPGGSIQTRDYYSDSSSKRRKSLDRSNSIRKTAASVVAEMDEMKSVANMKNSPECRHCNSNSLRDDYSETFELGYRDNASITNNGEKKEPTKKSRRWIKALNIWGLIHWRAGSKYEEEDRFSTTNGVDRSFSESWQDLRSEPNGDTRGGLNRKILRSNSSVSWRSSNGNERSLRNGARTNNNTVDLNGHNNKKDEFVLERNRSTRHSPNHVDNGLLKLYLAPPMRGNWRSASTGKSRANHTHTMARSVLRLY